VQPDCPQHRTQQKLPTRNREHLKEDAKAEMKEHGLDKDAKEHGHMTVTALTVVSDTCPK
jgi:hypothetical protein